MAVSLFTYSDVDSALTIDSTGNPVIRTNIDCINQSIKNILSTLKGERVMLPDFGSNLPLYVFEPLDAITAKLIQSDISQALSIWEPRITVISVTVQPDYDRNIYQINVNYVITTIGTPASFSAALVTAA